MPFTMAWGIGPEPGRLSAYLGLAVQAWSCGEDMRERFALWVVALSTELSMGCVGIPENIKPVESFDATRYLGKWYEIARLDHSFERGLTKVSATYSLRGDGGLKVVNHGWSAKDGTWKSATGKAFFVQDPGRGYLKVSFFGPFYGSYVVFDLDRAGYLLGLTLFQSVSPKFTEGAPLRSSWRMSPCCC